MKFFSFSPLKLSVIFLILTIHLLMLSSLAQAHKVRIFAYADGDRIICEAKFNNNKPAQNGTVEVFDNNTLLLSGTTDEMGIFSFPAPQSEESKDLLITINSGDGHRGEWKLLAEDYQQIVTDESHQHTEPEETTTRLETADKLYVLSKGEIRDLIKQEVAKQLTPIKRKLAEQKEQAGPSSRDILAGIGIIFGLMGLAAYFSSRKNNR